MDLIKTIAQELQVGSHQVKAAVDLIDQGKTIPFIARYRKEATGSLNDEQLRLLHERLVYLRNLEEKKEQVLRSIEEQGKLTPELKAQILAAQTLVLVEDFYRPYRPKKRTRATIAKENWSRWQSESGSRRSKVPSKRKRGRISQKKRKSAPWRRPSPAPGIFWPNRFPRRQITGSIYATPPGRRERCSLRQRMRKPRASTRCTMHLRKRRQSWPDTG